MFESSAALCSLQVKILQYTQSSTTVYITATSSVRAETAKCLQLIRTNTGHFRP